MVRAARATLPRSSGARFTECATKNTHVRLLSRVWCAGSAGTTLSLIDERKGWWVMADFTPEEAGPQTGERVVFWTWASIITAGLLLMITIPLTGR